MRDSEIRNIILSQPDFLTWDSKHSTKIVHEFCLWDARMDIAVIDEHLHGFEIKSAVDTLKRLPAQVEAYSKVFDYLSVVTENCHYGGVYKITPYWVGLYICSEAGSALKCIRQPIFNSNKSGFHIAQLLWREELIQVLEESGIKFRKRDRNWLLCETLAENLNVEVLAKLVRDKLLQRKQWRQSVQECV